MGYLYVYKYNESFNNARFHKSFAFCEEPKSFLLFTKAGCELLNNLYAYEHELSFRSDHIPSPSQIRKKDKTAKLFVGKGSSPR